MAHRPASNLLPGACSARIGEAKISLRALLRSGHETSATQLDVLNNDRRVAATLFLSLRALDAMRMIEAAARGVRPEQARTDGRTPIENLEARELEEVACVTCVVCVTYVT